MAKGFIYVVTTAGKDYEQDPLKHVPYRLENRLYFGPCKKFMRPKMKEGDFVFGVSSARTDPRRMLFTGRIEKSMPSKEAYDAFPKFHDSFKDHGWPQFAQEPFFVFCQGSGYLGKWLGPKGPKIIDGENKEILEFFNTCDAYWSGQNTLGKNNGSDRNPVAYYPNPASRRGYFMIHLETDKPEILVKMCMDRMRSEDVTR